MRSIYELIKQAIQKSKKKPNGNQRRRALRKGRGFMPYGYTLAYPGTQEYDRIMRLPLPSIYSKDQRTGSEVHIELLKERVAA